MKIKTSELTLEQINWAVAMCEGYTPIVHSRLATVMLERKNVRGVMVPEHLSSLRYATDWALGGPIVEREWRAISAVALRWCVENVADPADSTLLAFWMRCYVASKLGDEIDVPEELP